MARCAAVSVLACEILWANMPALSRCHATQAKRFLHHAAGAQVEWAANQAAKCHQQT